MFRANAVGLALSTSLWGLLVIFTVYLTTYSVRSVLGYTPSELLTLAAVQVIFLGIFHAIVSHNMDKMADFINKGNLDFILLKPVDSQLLTSLGQVMPWALVRMLIGVAVIAYLHGQGAIHVPSVWHIAGASITLILGIVVIYSIWFLFTTLLIWFPNMDNIVELLYNLNVSSRYPYEFYREVGVIVFLLLFPFSIALTVPTKMLLGTVRGHELVALVCVAIVLVAASRWFWLYALKHYVSASA